MRKLFEDKTASYGVKASVPEPTGVRAKKLPGSKDQGDKTNPKQGSSTIAQPPQVTSEDIDVSDDFEAIFEGTDLSEEFKEKALVIFESAVVQHINEHVEAIAEEMAAEFEAAKESLAEEMSGQLDQYLDYVIEQWMEENQLAVETGVKSELSETFMQGLRALFAENYVDIPEGKEDIVTQLAERLEAVEAQLNAALEENIELNSALGEYEREIAFAEMTEGLTDTQIAKLQALTEKVSFTNVDEFADKVGTLRESYFPSGDNGGDGEFDDDPIDLNEDAPAGNPAINAYAAAISRSVRK